MISIGLHIFSIANFYQQSFLAKHTYLYVHVYIYIYTHMPIYVCIYKYIQTQIIYLCHYVSILYTLQSAHKKITTKK